MIHHKKFFMFAVFILALSFIILSHGNNALAKSDNAPVCPGPAREGTSRCHARVVTDNTGAPNAATVPNGYGPLQLRGAYGVSGITSANQTIAIVDAYDHPNILSDLNKYNATFGIAQMNECPVSTGTVSSPCFQKVNQNGGTGYPRKDAGWALEIALDVEVAHAMCQNCNILLVEANSNSYTDLMATVDRARLMNAKVISNSYGSGEFSGETSFDNHFNYPGIAFTFSSGDSGYGAQYPAASPYVTAVGGTTLSVNGANAYVSESAWSGAGSGCSAYESKPSWQKDPGCSRRTIADISAVADPNTGAAVYDSVKYQGRSGWFKVGGTSLSAPLVAGIYALSGNFGGSANSLPYSASAGSLHDVVGGTNGACGGSYLCTAVSGFDGPTGLGSPNGTNAF